VTEIETQSAFIRSEPDAFVRVEAKAVHHELDDAKEVVDHLLEIHARGDRKLRVTVDMRAVRSLSRDARLHYQTPALAAVTAATAMVIDSGLSRVIGNFVIGLNRSDMLIKLFTDEQEARSWLEALPDD
jgi:hypothetical protein